MDADVIESFRTLLRQVTVGNEEEAERLHRCWVQLEEVGSAEPTGEGTPSD